LRIRKPAGPVKAPTSVEAPPKEAGPDWGDDVFDEETEAVR
jgi:hypothetical protein